VPSYDGFPEKSVKPSETNTVAIIDYEMGNLLSVQRACEQVGLQSLITSDSSIIMGSQAVILPGVGAFGDAMHNLKRLDLVSPLKEYIGTGKPFMGICLGMQLLLSESHEFGHHKGLDIINGSVLRFPSQGKERQKIKVPQVGWNRIFPPPAAAETLWAKSVLNGVPTGEFMYFVHSYYAIPESADVILSMTTYEDISYCSGIQSNNVMAFQFHPEKSGKKGITIYHNFKSLITTGGTA
jgi:imidazole glycerol-phosphate synthase subunit HisH